MVPCGKCLHCRVNKKSEWTSRLILEAASHPVTTFITLTYKPECLPDADKFEGGNLRPGDLSGFLKRLRSRLDYAGGPKVRFFGVGEYGSRGKRAHYHALIFGASVPHQLVDEAWGLGRVDAQVAGGGALAYCCGYVVKKFLNQTDYEGRVKPFTRVSRRPGLGVPAVRALASLVGSEHLEFGDVPRMWVHEGRQRPLGRTVRAHLREMLFPGGADDVREVARETSAHWMWKVLALSEAEVSRMMVESEKAAQLGLRELQRIAQLETI